jgi:hypothetical protein
MLTYGSRMVQEADVESTARPFTDSEWIRNIPGLTEHTRFPSAFRLTFILILCSGSTVAILGCGSSTPSQVSVETVLPQLGTLGVGWITCGPSDNEVIGLQQLPSSKFHDQVCAILAVDNHATVALPKIIQLASEGPFDGAIDLDLADPCAFEPIKNTLRMAGESTDSRSGTTLYSCGRCSFGVGDGRVRFVRVQGKQKVR